MKQTRCYEHLVPKKSLIQSCDTWPGVLMSAWVLPQSKRKFMPKSHVCQEHAHLKHTEAAFERKHRLQLKHSIWKARDQFLTWPHILCIASPSYLSVLFPSSPERNGRTFSQTVPGLRYSGNGVARAPHIRRAAAALLCFHSTASYCRH